MIQGHSLLTAVVARWVIMQMSFCLVHLVPGYFVIVACRFCLEVWLEFIHDVAHYLCHLEVDYKFYWDRLLYCCTPSILGGHLWISCVPPSSCKIFFAKTKIHIRFEDAILCTVKEFSRVELPSGLRSTVRADQRSGLSSRRTSPRSVYWISSTSKYRACYSPK